MKKKVLLVTVFILAGGLVLASESPLADLDPGTCPLEGFSLDPVKGKPEPPPACCDPALEPGANGNPLCFEGHTCCFDGVWRCNNPDGTPSCKPGDVCPSGCASVGESCGANEDCCSGKCKGGKCRK